MLLRRFKPGVTPDDYLRVLRETGSVDAARAQCCLPPEPAPPSPILDRVHADLRASAPRRGSDVFDPATGENLSAAFRPGGWYFDPLDTRLWPNLASPSPAHVAAIRRDAEELKGEKSGAYVGVSPGWENRTPADAPEPQRFASPLRFRQWLAEEASRLLGRPVAVPLDPPPSGRVVCPPAGGPRPASGSGSTRRRPLEAIDKLVSRTSAGVTLAELERLKVAKPRSRRTAPRVYLSPLERARLKPKPGRKPRA